MPQDGTRSVVYRSFFSCDDPKGVAECKTSRKSKAVLQKPEDKVDSQRTPKNLGMSFSYNEDRKDIVSKGPTDELHNLSSTQLMEVSRGAHKLNQVIDNWSKGLSFDSQSKDIAKDLLKGALDLQESLAMLGKLQEASQYMVKLKRKHKEKAGGGELEGADIERTTSDSFGIERTTSDRFGYHTNKMEFQKPRLSVDGSSKDCYDELREAIRESFARQNLLPKNSAEEKGHCDKRKSNCEETACFNRRKCCTAAKAHFESTKLDLPMDFPSTSSSQTSVFHSHEYDSFDSSMSKFQEEKPKCPNLIAKLMGLEDIPTKPWQSTLQKEKSKQLNHWIPTLDMDLPKATEPPCTFQKVDPHRRTLVEPIETVQFQGLLSNKSIDGSKHCKHLSNVSDSKRGLAHDAPPIVIMKPLHHSVSFEEELQKQRPMHEDLYSKVIIRKWKMEKPVALKQISDRRGALDFSEIKRKLEVEMSPLKRLTKDKGEKDIGNLNVLKRSDDRIIRVQENLSSTKIKASAPVKPKARKKELMEKKVDEIQRKAPNTREPMEVSTAKFRGASKLQTVNKPASMYLKKPEREHNLSKNRASQQKSKPPSSTVECSTLTASRSANIRKKNAKNEKQINDLPSTVKVEKQCKNDDIQIEPRYEDKHEVTVIKITSPECPPTDQVQSSNLGSDDGKRVESCLCDSTKLIVHEKSDIKSTGDTNYNSSYISTEEQPCTVGDTTRDLLLGNSSFLRKARELFHLDAYQPILQQTNNSHDDGVADSKLLLDCAKELLEHKRLQCTLAAHPLTHITLQRSISFIFLERLVAEICEGIEQLRGYQTLSDGSLAVDTLYMVLRKDILSKGVVSGAWDFGWRYGFSLDEIEQVAFNIEKRIFSEIIEDVLRDFCGLVPCIRLNNIHRILTCSSPVNNTMLTDRSGE